MIENENVYLTTARELLMGRHIEDACAHYYKANELNPKNAEAEFFSDYLGYLSLVEERDGSSAANAFSAMTKCLEGAVEDISKAVFEEVPDAEFKGEAFQAINRLMVISRLVEIYTPITRYLFTNRLSTTRDTIESGVLGLYALGSAIEKVFGGNLEFMKEAVKAWKEAVALQCQFYGYKYNGVTPDEYVTKIQKVEPAYTKPKKAGCVSTSK